MLFIFFENYTCIPIKPAIIISVQVYFTYDHLILQHFFEREWLTVVGLYLTTIFLTINLAIIFPIHRLI